MISQTNTLLEILDRMKNTRIAVIGDLMLDRYIWGDVARISPEAPVPVVEIASESASLGGAANVSNNVHALGAHIIPVGVIGADLAGENLKSLSRQSGFETRGIITDTSRRTTVKTRVIAHNQHVVRIDRESKERISKSAKQEILSFFEAKISSIDAIIFEDYNKGLLTPELISDIIALARKHNVIMTVDPKFDNFWAYRHVTVFKPNRREIEAVLGVRLETESEIAGAAQRLKEKLQCENVLITLGEHGLHLLDASGAHHNIPTRAKKVHDVSGAGDTVIGTLTAALAAGASISNAASLANFAAGVVVAELGAVPVSPEKLREAIAAHEKE
ncbi:MAG: D-glycero-beta-D-manno-heptose-7-phosphate kinase [bacterium]